MLFPDTVAWVETAGWSPVSHRKVSLQTSCDTHSGPWGGQRWQARPWQAVAGQLRSAASCGPRPSAAVGSHHSNTASSSAPRRHYPGYDPKALPIAIKIESTEFKLTNKVWRCSNRPPFVTTTCTRTQTKGTLQRESKLSFKFESLHGCLTLMLQVAIVREYDWHGRNRTKQKKLQVISV